MTQFDLPAANYMVSPPHTIRDTARLGAAARAMDELGLSALPVVDGARRLTGLLERSDLVRVGRLRGSRAERHWWLPDLTVAECMQSVVPVVHRTTPLRDCARRMLERGEHHLFVVVDRELEGVISTTEILRAVASEPSSMTVGEMSNDPAMTIAAAAPLSLASERLAASSERPLIVLDGERPIGIFSRTELTVCLEADSEEPTRRWSDERVLTLPASTPAHHAAQQAIDAQARYIIAHHGARGYSVIPSLAFASIVADLPFTQAKPRADAAPRRTVSLAAPDYPRDSIESTRAAAPIDPPLPARHGERDAPRERGLAVTAEPSSAEPAHHDEHEEDVAGGEV